VPEKERKRAADWVCVRERVWSFWIWVCERGQPAGFIPFLELGLDGFRKTVFLFIDGFLEPSI
jgi:hypothetical protein